MNLKSNNKHIAALELFFKEKLNQEKIKHKLNKKRKTEIDPEKKKKLSKKYKQLEFNLDDKEFRLVDKKNVSLVTAKRIPQADEKEIIEKEENKIKKNNKKILNTKYKLLFEYENLENYDSLFKSDIEPLEESNKRSEKKIGSIEEKKDKNSNAYKTNIDNLMIEKNGYKEELKRDALVDKKIKTDLMKNFIEKQSEIYNAYMENIEKNKFIKEITIN
tara:strand:+ start:247 stop:900 length:654 start_codon:yes stop_codon:yes gene_type:complete